MGHLTNLRVFFLYQKIDQKNSLHIIDRYSS